MSRLQTAVLKSPSFGPPEHGALPYRIDQLRALGHDLSWDDRRSELRGRRARIIGRLEALTTPFLQTWQMRRSVGRADVTVAMFESEGHALALARRLGVRRRTFFVVVSCWLGDLALRSGRLRRAVYRWLYRRVDLVTVFSANQVQLLRDELGIPESRIAVIPFGVDTEELARCTRSNEGYLLAVGRDAARDWDTLYAGVAGTGRRVLVLARPSQLPRTRPPDEIEILGYVDRGRYLALLAACGGVLLVTREAAYPSGQTVLLEALALGKRVVMTDTPAVRTFAGSLPVAWVSVGDSAALHDSISTLDAGPTVDVPTTQLDASRMWGALDALIRERVTA